MVLGSAPLGGGLETISNYQHKSTYRLRQIGHALRTGSARIEGQVSLGSCWPDEPHAWIVTMLEEQRVVHVLCSDRPSWGRYVDAGVL